MKLVLLHSPLVGPGTWDAVVPRLRARGHEIVAPDLMPVMRGAPPFYPKLAAAAVCGGADGAIVVAHSGAGALLPEIARLANLRGAVFVDALLPHPGRSWFETAPSALAAHLRGLACGDRLPPWHLWWPDGVMAALLPDAAMRARFTDALCDVPLAYCEEQASRARLETRSAYLRLSDGYQREADWAETQEWPVTRLSLHHLAVLTHPQDAAANIERLALGF